MFIWTQDDMGRPPAGRTWKSSMSQNQIRLVRAPATGSHKLNLDGWYKGSTLSRYWKKWRSAVWGIGLLFDMWPIVWKIGAKGLKRTIPPSTPTFPYPWAHLILSSIGLFFLTRLGVQLVIVLIPVLQFISTILLFPSRNTHDCQLLLSLLSGHGISTTLMQRMHGGRRAANMRENTSWSRDFHLYETFVIAEKIKNSPIVFIEVTW